MGETRAPAPLYVDAFALCQWLLRHFGEDSRVLPCALCRTALELLDAITLALKNRRREVQMEIADESLIRLRIQLRLAGETGYLNQSQMLYALERADVIGRQLGGWLRRLGPV